VLTDDEFVADVQAAPPDGIHLWWLGQSGFLLKADGHYLLLDPYLSDSLTSKYEHSDTPHVRMTRRVVDPARLDFVDVVTASHGHTDHLDAETIRAIRPSALVCPLGLRGLANRRAGLEPLMLGEAGATVRASCFEITAVRSEHDAPGPAFGYVVRAGRATLYHSGDTVAYPGLGESLRRYGLDLAIMPINGKLGNMDGTDAAQVAHGAAAELVVPCHFEMFEFNTASPQEFVRECQRLGQPHRVLRAGERLTLGG
jgi:L-ascorbate metabolism protein UlaG (beta-lactamase superfamily)